MKTTEELLAQHEKYIHRLASEGRSAPIEVHLQKNEIIESILARVKALEGAVSEQRELLVAIGVKVGTEMDAINRRLAALEHESKLIDNTFDVHGSGLDRLEKRLTNVEHSHEAAINEGMASARAEHAQSDICQGCGHASHEPGKCFNMASDNECHCGSPTDDEKEAAAKAWGAANEKAPSGQQTFAWWNPTGHEPEAELPIELFCAISGFMRSDLTGRVNYKEYSTERAAWLALYDALKSCGMLLCPRCHGNKVTASEYGPDADMIRCPLCCPDDTPATGTLRELQKKWEQQVEASIAKIKEYLANGTDVQKKFARDSRAKCAVTSLHASELAAALDAMEPSEEEMNNAAKKWHGFYAFTQGVRWAYARIKGEKITK